MNKLARALAAVSLSAAFSLAAFGQAPAALPDAPVPQPQRQTQPLAQPLPDAPKPQIPSVPPATKPTGFIPRAIDFFSKRSIVNDSAHMYDFALQQPILQRPGITFSIEGGTLSGNFGNPKLVADRDMLRSVMGIRPGEPCTLCSTLYPSNGDTNHASGVAFGIRLTFGR
ncbi:MAG TPA: hypothetical protein VL625_05080 [Patescibacteria group bacterium]|nr:hypothetical protein [Patescibacteria group bacterium]